MNRKDLEEMLQPIAPGMKVKVTFPADHGLAGKGYATGMECPLFGAWGTIVLGPRGMLTEVRGSYLSITAQRRAFRRLLIGVAIHEIAHALERGPVEVPEPIRELGLVEVRARWHGEAKLPTQCRPWHNHGPVFLRLVLHLIARARALGIDVDENDAVSNEVYQLSHLRHYRAAIANEPEAWVAQPIESVIRHVPPPRPFVELFDNDRRKYYALHTEEARRMVTGLIDRLKQRKTQKTLGFLELVRKVASGDTPDMADVEEVLSASNKTAEELAQAVEVFHKRQRWSDSIQHAAQAEERRPTINDNIKKADAILEAARRKHADAVNPLWQELREIDKANSESRRAQRELERSCLDVSLLEELKAADAEIGEAHVLVSQLEAEGRRAARGRSCLAEIEYAHPGQHDQLRLLAERHARAAEAAEAELPQARARLEAAQQRERELRAKLLVP